MENTKFFPKWNWATNNQLYKGHTKTSNKIQIIYFTHRNANTKMAGLTTPILTIFHFLNDFNHVSIPDYHHKSPCLCQVYKPTKDEHKLSLWVVTFFVNMFVRFLILCIFSSLRTCSFKNDLIKWYQSCLCKRDDNLTITISHIVLSYHPKNLTLKSYFYWHPWLQHIQL